MLPFLRSGRASSPWGLQRDRRGAAALEFALTAPVLILVLGQILQFGLILFAYNDMSHVAWNVARQVATGSMPAATAASEVRERLISWGAPPTVEISDAPLGLPEITVEISLPFAALRLFDPMNLLGTGAITVRAAAPR
ncbi:TadE/TadG family type IV pilus assembly protein [Marinimicrococcus flavescens]|uniref:Pilus assembly protein n=1 Tax=Marinimicrococcus flavescens TaxID=3031815 RepID=A0AAP3XQ09_9PROT|nr:pilus assembly protein [Marinimicrococcus flavescens]